MKIIIDIDGSGKTCGECKYRITNLPVATYMYGIPIRPFCGIFHKKFPYVKGKKTRLTECLNAEQSEINISIEDIETFTNEEWE